MNGLVKMKHKSTKYYKARAIRLFSLWIRQRDADDNGYCRCCTCRTLHHWRYIDAGHFMPCQHEGTRFHDKNCHPQDKKCNNKNWNQGEQFLHSQYIDNRYGDGTAEKLSILSKVSCKRSWFDYKIIGDELLEKLKANNYLTI